MIDTLKLLHILKIGLSGIVRRYGYQNVQELPATICNVSRQSISKWEDDIALNIDVCDLYAGMEFEKLQQYDVVYLCGGNTHYLLERINATRFNKSLMEYINDNGLVIGISAGSPLKNNVKLTNTCALVIRDFPDGVEIIGE